MANRDRTRREILGALGAGAAAASLAPAAMASGVAAAASTVALPTEIAPATPQSPAIVLVHGTWHGGWVWRRVRRELQAAGYDVYAPTCTGCGERRHLMSPDVGLDTHITDIANVIEFEELERVVLVGHSFAGLTITGVADRMRERIAHLVYFDALVPSAGRMSGVARKPDGSFPEYWDKRREKFIEGYQMDFFSEYPMAMLMPEDRIEDIEWMRRRITPHPSRGWSDALVLRNGGYEGLPRSFIRCVGQIYSPTSDNMVGIALTDPGFQMINVPFARNAMVTNPREIAGLLASMTTQSAAAG